MLDVPGNPRFKYSKLLHLNRDRQKPGGVDGRGHAMFGWRMEEEAKLEFTITINWCREDGSIATTQLATLDRGACRSAEDVGLQLADAKPIRGRPNSCVTSRHFATGALLPNTQHQSLNIPSLRVLGARDIRNQSFLIGNFLDLDW